MNNPLIIKVKKLKKAEYRLRFFHFYLLITRMHSPTHHPSQEALEKTPEQQTASLLATLPLSLKFRFALRGFWIAVLIAFLLFMLSFVTDFFGEKIIIPPKYFAQEIQLSQRSHSYFLPSQYLYDGKKYPDLPEQMPVFELRGTWANTQPLLDRMQMLKWGNVRLPSLSSLALSQIDFHDPKHPDYHMQLNLQEGHLSWYALELTGTHWDIKDPKSFLKKSEKKLKELGISLEGYGTPELQS